MVSINCGMAGEAGGVLRLFRSYCDAAKKLEHEIRLFSLWEDTDWKTVDLVHFAPCDASMLVVARTLHEKGMRFVVSPILDKTFPATALRAVTCGDRVLGGYYRSHLGAAQEICRLSNGICVMSADEGKRVRRGLGVASRPIHVVRPALVLNGPDPCSVCDTITPEASEYVLFVGDLGNERKNVLRLIEACKQAGLPLVLIGSLGDSSYGRKVREVLSTSRSAKHYGRISATPTVLSAMARCRVFALPSMTEGIGLAALEAGAVGARVVITKFGGTHDYFGDSAWYVDPRSVRSIVEGLRAAWEAKENLPLRKHIAEDLTLAHTANGLDQLYADAVTIESEAIQKPHFTL